MLMALGMFVFEMGTLPYEEIRRRIAWRHEGAARLGALPENQFLGPDSDEVSIQGTLVPQIAGKASSIARIEEMGAQGDEYALVDGLGNVIGHYVIRGLDTRSSHFIENGIARKIDFTIDLGRVD